MDSDEELKKMEMDAKALRDSEEVWVISPEGTIHQPSRIIKQEEFTRVPSPGLPADTQSFEPPRNSTPQPPEAETSILLSSATTGPVAAPGPTIWVQDRSQQLFSWHPDPCDGSSRTQTCSS